MHFSPNLHHSYFTKNTKYDPMKKRTTTMIVALALAAGAFAPTSLLADESEQIKRARALYQQGLSAMEEGKYNIAQMSFREVLRIYPKHIQARKHLLYISSNRNNLETKKRRDALRKVIIPKVNFDNSTVTEALNVLAVQVERESKQQVTPNFIVQDPSGAFKQRKINLRLNRIPAETLLRYIIDQANGIVRYDKHAIVIRPRKAATPAAQPKTPEPDDEPAFGE